MRVPSMLLRPTVCGALLTALALGLSAPGAEAGPFGKKACTIKSPVRGLHVADITTHGFEVEWAQNYPPQVPKDIEVTLDGRDATPNIPFWMMLFKKGAGFSTWKNGIEPGGTYHVVVTQISKCGKASSSSITVTMPLLDNRDLDMMTTTLERSKAEVRDVVEGVEDFEWTETELNDLRIDLYQQGGLRCDARSAGGHRRWQRKTSCRGAAGRRALRQRADRPHPVRRPPHHHQDARR